VERLFQGETIVDGEDALGAVTGGRFMIYPSAAEYLPTSRNLAALRRAAAGCKGCDLYKDATQTVFGEGARRASVILVGEVPGDEEDLTGRPFVGPAGRLLDAALEEAGIDRDAVYVTNAVKHFRWEPRGKRRLRKKPTTRQIEACKPWLQAEILVIQPRVVVCLGATAAQSLLGKQFRITRARGKFFEADGSAAIMATYHPSAILRAPDKDDRQRKHAEFVDELRAAAARTTTKPNSPKRAAAR
jgi:uracil-DNA glycosylase